MAALIFKLRKEFIGSATQFEAGATFRVNQKWLSEVLHGKKYLGGKQKPPSGKGTKSDPLQIGSEKEETEETETQEVKQGAKHKPDDNDDEGEEDDNFKTMDRKTVQANDHNF